MLTCKACQKVLQGNEQYCPSCGSKLELCDHIDNAKQEIVKEPKENDDFLAKAGAIADEAIGYSDAGSTKIIHFDGKTILEIQALLEAAVQANPKNGEYKYLLACAKISLGSGKTGTDEIISIAKQYPQLVEPAGRVANPGKWPSPFEYHMWNINQNRIPHSILSTGSQGCRVVSIRDGCHRLVAFFRYLPQQNLGSSFNPSLRAAIRLRFMNTPYGAVVGTYVLIDTNPSQPYTSETILNVGSYSPDSADMSLCGYWLTMLLTQQQYTYVVLAEPTGNVYFNQKVEFDHKTKSDLHEASKHMESLTLRSESNPDQFQKAMQYLMNNLSMDEIQF